MKSKKSTIFNVIFLIIIFLLTIWYVFSGEDLKAIYSNIHNADSAYWLIPVILVVGFILSEALVIHYLMRSVGQETKLSHCFLYSFIGFFFSCITPSASGGQPAQMVYMKKDGIPLTTSTLVLMIVAITYKAVLVIVGAVIFIFRPSRIMHFLHPVLGWCIFGMILNVIAIAFMITAIFQPAILRWMISTMLKLGKKIHLVRHEENIIKRTNSFITRYNDAASFFIKNKIVIVNAFILTFVQRLFIFLITYFVCLSFHFEQENIVTITCLQAMIYVAIDMLPLPGGMGINEALFRKTFEPMLLHLTTSVLVISRGLSYYTQLLISALFTIVAQFFIGKDKGEEK
ncbi:MAG: flippase-like domain-containing protein [Lachnospiraceae bacterium]|nr:flippase-like domain-containing protein [Lachnospiraceae bacterium]